MCVLLRFSQALQEAAQVDRLVDEETGGGAGEEVLEDKLPLLGVPFTVKEAFTLQGTTLHVYLSSCLHSPPLSLSRYSSLPHSILFPASVHPVLHFSLLSFWSLLSLSCLSLTVCPHTHTHTHPSAMPNSTEIGRASCRARVYISVVAGSLKKKNNNIPYS